MCLNRFPSTAHHIQDAAVIYKVTRKTTAWSSFVLRQPLMDAGFGLWETVLRGHRLLHPKHYHHRMWEVSRSPLKKLRLMDFRQGGLPLTSSAPWHSFNAGWEGWPYLFLNSSLSALQTGQSLTLPCLNIFTSRHIFAYAYCCWFSKTEPTESHKGREWHK